MQNIRKILLLWIIRRLVVCLIQKPIFIIYWKRKKYWEGLYYLCIIYCICISYCRIGRGSFWRSNFYLIILFFPYYYPPSSKIEEWTFGIFLDVYKYSMSPYFKGRSKEYRLDISKHKKSCPKWAALFFWN